MVSLATCMCSEQHASAKGSWCWVHVLQPESAPKSLQAPLLPAGLVPVPCACTLLLSMYHPLYLGQACPQLGAVVGAEEAQAAHVGQHIARHTGNARKGHLWRLRMRRQGAL